LWCLERGRGWAGGGGKGNSGGGGAPNTGLGALCRPGGGKGMGGGGATAICLGGLLGARALGGGGGAGKGQCKTRGGGGGAGPRKLGSIWGKPQNVRVGGRPGRVMVGFGGTGEKGLPGGGSFLQKIVVFVSTHGLARIFCFFSFVWGGKGNWGIRKGKPGEGQRKTKITPMVARPGAGQHTPIFFCFFWGLLTGGPGFSENRGNETNGSGEKRLAGGLTPRLVAGGGFPNPPLRAGQKKKKKKKKQGKVTRGSPKRVLFGKTQRLKRLEGRGSFGGRAAGGAAGGWLH